MINKTTVFSAQNNSVPAFKSGFKFIVKAGGEIKQRSSLTEIESLRFLKAMLEKVPKMDTFAKRENHFEITHSMSTTKRKITISLNSGFISQTRLNKDKTYTTKSISVDTPEQRTLFFKILKAFHNNH